MENIEAWFEEVRRDLETKLKVYRDLNDGVERRPVIFTNTYYVEQWSAKTNPIIRTNEPLTPIPLEYNPSLADITSEAMTPLRDIEREQKLSSFTVLLFEVGINRPELKPSSVELHVAFSPAQEPLQNPCSRYFNFPSYLPPLPGKSGTLSSPYITKVRVRQYTFGSGAADSTLYECFMAIVFKKKQTTSAETVPHLPLRPLTYVSCSKNQAMKCQFENIESRLGEELRTHLREKLDQFLNRSSSGSRRSIIFTHQPDWWITDLTPTVVVTGPPPPIPSCYDHEHFNIEEDALDYVCEVARRQPSPELYVSSIRLGAEDNLQMHMLFSYTGELIIEYYENRDKLPLESENHPYKHRRRVDCEYRQYPENPNDRRFLKKNFSMLRKVEKLRVRASAPSKFWWVGYNQLDDLRPIANRMGSVLRSHLDKMLTSFIKRDETKWAYPVAFTNDKKLWVSRRSLVIELCDIPPMPPHYDYDTFDIVQDVADYLRELFSREAETRMSFYLSTLTFGEGASSQIHFLMTQHNDMGRFLYVKSEELRRESELILSEPRSGRVSLGPSTSSSASTSTITVETGEPPVKRQRLSEPEASSMPSLEFTEESPTPGPSTRK